jgi:hypothetical protein
VFNTQGLPWPYNGEFPPASYVFQSTYDCPKYHHATTYWLDLDQTKFRKLTRNDAIEIGVLKQLHMEHFDPVPQLISFFCFCVNMLSEREVGVQ